MKTISKGYTVYTAVESNGDANEVNSRVSNEILQNGPDAPRCLKRTDYQGEQKVSSVLYIENVLRLRLYTSYIASLFSDGRIQTLESEGVITSENESKRDLSHCPTASLLTRVVSESIKHSLPVE